MTDTPSMSRVRNLSVDGNSEKSRDKCRIDVKNDDDV